MNERRILPVPCPILSLEIGTAIEQIERPITPAEKLQWEHILASLETQYERQCGGKASRDRQEPSDALGSIRFLGGAFALNLVSQRANGVRVILGGNDGVLVTIDGNGVIHVLPPEGPGDPEVRQAVSSIVQGFKVLAGLAAAGAANAATP